MLFLKRLIACVALFWLLTSSCSAVELTDVYKILGPYRVVASGGVRLYFPESAKAAIPRVLSGLIGVRQSFNKLFPDQKNYEATVLLSDHDDRISSSSDPELDWITLGMFEEIGALSTRAYSLEKRFALRLANILILRTLGSSQNALKRKLAILAVPQWFLDGLALDIAFKLDSIHISRLFDMARFNRLYSLVELDTLVSQPTLVREEMRFQAHSMISFWGEKYGATAGIDLMKRIFRDPTGFRKLFKKYYGVDMNKAYYDYMEFVWSKCKRGSEGSPCDIKVEVDPKLGGGFFRSLREIGPDEKVWVSSKRYFTETYDLYYQKGKNRPKVLIKNVHPLIYVDGFDNEIYVGKYWVNSLRQRRLGIWKVDVTGRKKKLVSEAGSFKPLGKRFGRIFYLNSKSGISRIMSVDPEFANSTRVEYEFAPEYRPLDIALDKSCQGMYFVFESHDLKKHLAFLSIAKDDKEKFPQVLYSGDGEIRALQFIDNKLWFAGEKDFMTTQLFSYEVDQTDGKKVERRLKKYTELPGGVWDFTLEQNGDFAISTLHKGEFHTTRINPEQFKDLSNELPEITIAHKPKFAKVNSSVYKKEFRTSYWMPIVSEDEEGPVFGVYSYRSDRLNRSNIVVAPKYGFESKNWGYEGTFMQRIGLFKLTLSINDEVSKRSYLSNEYFERTRAKIFDVKYPFNLSTTLNFGANLNKRGIAKIPENGSPYPTVGRDHSFYATVNHTAIRTEPYWKVFPRKGRTVVANYQKGTDFLDGELRYDHMSLRWNEYFPIKKNLVLTVRGYVAEDDKENNIRRPDDLSLGGGGDFLRGYDSAYRSGNSLRAMSLHLGHPIKVGFPKFMKWIKNEFMVGEVFWEAGDVKLNRKFQYVFDRGAEIRMQALLFRRIPIVLRFGAAWANDGKEKKTYFSADVSELSDLLY